MAITKTDVYDVQVGKPLDLRLAKTDVGARNNIPMAIRYPGMVVYTLAENSYWMWPPTGATNSDWVALPLLDSVSPRLWFESTAPTSGVGQDGDIYFFDTPSGVEIYQKTAGDWGTALGKISKGGSVTQNNTLTFTTTSTDLGTEYPDAQPGDVVFSEHVSGHVQFTKLANNKWSMSSITIV